MRRAIFHSTSRVNIHAAYRSDRRRRWLRRTGTVLVRVGLATAALVAAGGVLLLADHLNGP